MNTVLNLNDSTHHKTKIYASSENSVKKPDVPSGTYYYSISMLIF